MKSSRSTPKQKGRGKNNSTQSAATSAKPRTWQGGLTGKGKIKGDIYTTGIEWEASVPKP